METEILTIPLTQKFYIWLRWNLYCLGLTTICAVAYSSYHGLPSCFKSIELNELDAKVTDLAYAMSEVQDTQVGIVKGTIRIAKK